MNTVSCWALMTNKNWLESSFIKKFLNEESAAKWSSVAGRLFHALTTLLLKKRWRTSNLEWFTNCFCPTPFGCKAGILNKAVYHQNPGFTPEQHFLYEILSCHLSNHACISLNVSVNYRINFKITFVQFAWIWAAK